MKAGVANKRTFEACYLLWLQDLVSASRTVSLIALAWVFTENGSLQIF